MNKLITIDPSFYKTGIRQIVVARIANIRNKAPSGVLEERCNSAYADLSKLKEEEFLRHSVLAGYRSLVASFERSTKRFPPSAETLFKLSKRRGALPKISALVDSYNVVAIESMLSIGAHDSDSIKFPISFRLAKKGEQFRAVGSMESKYTQEGDYIYSDQEKILAWMDSKDADSAKITDTTTNALLIVQGNNVTSAEYRKQALENACQLISTSYSCCYEIVVIQVPF